MEGLKAKRGRIKGSLTRTANFASSITPQTSIQDVQSRYDKLEEFWREFMDVEDELCTNYATDPQFVDQTSEFEEFENRYYQTKALLKLAIEQRSPRTSQHDIVASLVDQQNTFISRLNSTHLPGQSHSSSPNNSSGLSELRLPKINIPTFSGDYKEWISFQDLFVSLIHDNQSLTSAQKFQYLKGILKGEAAALLRHLPTTDASYAEAWDKLKKRYGKTNQIIQSFIKTFMDIPSLHQSSSSSLRKVSNTADEVIRGLKSLGSSAEARDHWLLFIIINKLDIETKQAWAQKMSEKDENYQPTINDLLCFLNRRCDSLESCTNRKSNVPTSHTKSLTVSTSSTSLALSCIVCKGSHQLYQCREFKLLNVESRRDLTAKNSICFNCLHSGHSAANCRSKLSCHHCSKRHHSLLHISQSPRKSSATNVTSSVTVEAHGTSNQNALISTSEHDNQTSNSVQAVGTSVLQGNVQFQTALLPTAIVYIHNSHGVAQPCRALLDSGSQVSLITEACVQRLNLTRKHAKFPISGVGACDAGITRGVVSLQIFSRNSSEPVFHLSAFILSRLTAHMSSFPINAIDLSHITTLDLADPEFDKCKPIDIIIGSDKFFDIIREGKIMSTHNTPLAQLTIFGWVLAGQISQQSDIKSDVICNPPNISHYHVEVDLDMALKRFWEVEELNVSSTGFRTAEENTAEEHYVRTHSRNKEGRYVVKLPFKEPQTTLGTSLNTAIRRLGHMENRFKSNPELKKLYKQFLKEYLDLGHMTEVPSDQINSNDNFYLPHHGVFKMSSSTTKVRVVFDGSCKTSNGLSLNDSLLIGPTIQHDLISILIRFRLYQVALTADIAKMYRQVLVDPDDTRFQRIVWGENVKDPIIHFQLNTVTYGTSPAPFLATRTLLQLAEDEGHTVPNAARLLKQDFYVDDFMSGTHSITEALQTIQELSSLLQSGGFELRKWASNSAEVLQNISPQLREISPLQIQSNTASLKVLGIQWHPAQDCFSFSVSLESNIISEISKIFDPLGWLTPSTILAKILFQRLWLLQLDWDTPIPTEVANHWTTLRQRLHQFEHLNVPRWLGTHDRTFQLHGFCDASEKAYAAAVYCRQVLPNNEVYINLLAAKSRVAPLKQISLPRLELCGALLLVRLLKFVKEALLISDIQTFAWTDSTIVLAWLEDNPRRWKTFVANRTSEIIESLPRRHWRHVSTSENPADCASRGIHPDELLQHNLWWHGPLWLRQDLNAWPSQFNYTHHDKHHMEERRNYALIHHSESAPPWFNELCSKYSSLSKLIKIIAYCLRFNTNNPDTIQFRKNEFLTAREIENSLRKCIKLAQRDSFDKELKALRKGAALRKTSRLSSLSPFLDSHGILRVGGRIDESLCNFDTKHPILLSKDHILTTLIVRECHAKHLHAGFTLLASILRQNYWILGQRSLLKSIIHKCVKCFRYKKLVNEQLMGNLPKYRVQASPPFSRTGCDYAGPILLKNHKGRGAKMIKGYICVFVCMVVKAIHLEIVTDMTTEAFLAALRRFISRRGKCSDIFSDNGTTFIGASRSLKKSHAAADVYAHNVEVSKTLAADNITWHFIPPYSPNFGGLWESNVKSIKQHLKRVIGNSILTYEEMSTFLCQVESVLNSRPLCLQSTYDIDIEPLTPSHFLIGRPLTSIPEPDLRPVHTNRLTRWQLVQQMFQGFWARWHKEYLASLQSRPKWHKPNNVIKEGLVVLIKEENLPPGKWSLGRITKCHPGQDGLTRVVTLQTKGGEIKRSISKVFPLPID